MISVYCAVSGKLIPEERVEALIMLGVPYEQMTCVEHSQAKRRKGIYMGEVGTSRLLIVDDVRHESVRDVFKNTDHSQETETEDNETDSE